MKKLFYIAAAGALLLLCVSCAATGLTVIQTPSPISDDIPVSDDPQKTETGGNSEDEDAPLLVVMTSDGFTVGEPITYKFMNMSDSTANILNIPRLYKGTEHESNLLPYADGVGFCGTPDCIAANSASLEWTLDAEYLFGSELSPGSYLLAFDVLNDDYDVICTLYTEFEIHTPIVYIS